MPPPGSAGAAVVRSGVRACCCWRSLFNDSWCQTLGYARAGYRKTMVRRERWLLFRNARHTENQSSPVVAHGLGRRSSSPTSPASRPVPDKLGGELLVQGGQRPTPAGQLAGDRHVGYQLGFFLRSTNRHHCRCSRRLPRWPSRLECRVDFRLWPSGPAWSVPGVR